MQSQSHNFVGRAREGLADSDLQKALARFQTGFTVKRAEAAARLPEFEALRDEAVEAGPPGAWGAGKVRLDRALGLDLPALSEGFEAPDADEPGPFALARPPEDGWLRLRLRDDRPWLDWRITPVFLEGAETSVQVEWIDPEGRRGRYLQAMTVPAQPSEPGELEAPLAEAVVAARRRAPAADFAAPTEPLLGAEPPLPGNCQNLPLSLLMTLPLFALLRRRQ